MGQPIDLEGWTCPAPLRDHPTIVMGHGGGGRLMSDLIEHVFRRTFAKAGRPIGPANDAVVLAWPGASGERLALTTDAYVVRPLVFPGGTIGDLAVNGTINDLAMMGAQPRWITAAFVLEEGLPIATLATIVESMARAAVAAGVDLVAGDTKVVEKGHGDGCYIATTGAGTVPAGLDWGPHRVAPGDVVVLSGPLGDHGVAILSVREGLDFECPVISDTAALWPLIEPLIGLGPRVHALRDITRGGLAAVLNEVARDARLGIVLEDEAVPARPEVRAACELLGLDPLLVACEGRCALFVEAAAADEALRRLRSHPLGREAVAVGAVQAEHPGLVVARTALGPHRIIPWPLGEQLPRIC